MDWEKYEWQPYSTQISEVAAMQRILLAISGLNPQVITETLYCLHMEGRAVQAIHIITTRPGKDSVLTALLDNGKGKFYQFCTEYELAASGVDFHPDNIHVPKNTEGKELDDILSQEDNEAFLKLCLRLTANLTADSRSAVYFLVAGGRKTMTSCVSFAAQMYGRKQDRIFHVLVSPEFEGHRDFWYPPKESRLLKLRDKNGEPFYKETRYATVQLISIPFLSLRKHLPGHLLTGPDTPGALMARLVREEERVFTLSLTGRTVTYGSLQMDIKPAHMALLACFAEIRLHSCDELSQDPTDCPPWFLGLEELFARQTRLTALYETIRGTDASGMSDTGITNLNAENFNSYKSRIKSELQTNFGTLADALIIQSWGKRPNTRYGLRINKKGLVLLH